MKEMSDNVMLWWDDGLVFRIWVSDENGQKSLQLYRSPSIDCPGVL